MHLLLGKLKTRALTNCTAIQSDEFQVQSSRLTEKLQLITGLIVLQHLISPVSKYCFTIHEYNMYDLIILLYSTYTKILISFR